MENALKKITAILLFAVSLFTACKKEKESIPNPNTPVSQDSMQLIINNLPEDLRTTIHSMKAVLTIIDSDNQETMTNVHLDMSYNGHFVTQKFKLATGNYKITRLFLVNTAGTVLYVAPMAGSAKAPLVTKPLSVAFTKTSGKLNTTTVEVVMVEPGDQPQSFGYPAGSFHGNFSQNPNPSPFIKIKVKGIFQIGDVLYDSIPSSLILTTYDNNGHMSTSYLSLAAGTNEVLLSRSAAKYELQVSRWGISEKITLMKSDIEEGAHYILGGSRAPKKLKQELTYKLTNGQYVPESKILYFYDNTNGNLRLVEYYERGASGTNVLSMKDIFFFNSTGKVEKIDRVDGGNKLMESTSFNYDAQGKIINMTEKVGDDMTTAQVTYTSLQNAYGISVYFQYSHRHYTMYNNLAVANGNIISSMAATSHLNSETAYYQYDTNINPYVHMNWPDLVFSNKSKNNVVSVQKSYTGSYPLMDPYSFNYTYDNEGYPKEVIKHFKAPATNQHLFTLKTVYTY